jgi:hypothetical protein
MLDLHNAMTNDALISDLLQDSNNLTNRHDYYK